MRSAPEVDATGGSDGVLDAAAGGEADETGAADPAGHVDGHPSEGAAVEDVSGAALGRVWSDGATASWPVVAPARRGVARAQTNPPPTSAARASSATATRWRPAPASSARTREPRPSGGRTNGGGCDMTLLRVGVAAEEPSYIARRLVRAVHTPRRPGGR